VLCAVYSGACATVPLVSELAEREAEDERWTGVGREDSGILADGTDQSSCVCHMAFSCLYCLLSAAY